MLIIKQSPIKLFLYWTLHVAYINLETDKYNIKTDRENSIKDNRDKSIVDVSEPEKEYSEENKNTLSIW